MVDSVKGDYIYKCILDTYNACIQAKLWAAYLIQLTAKDREKWLKDKASGDGLHLGNPTPFILSITLLSLDLNLEDDPEFLLFVGFLLFCFLRLDFIV